MQRCNSLASRSTTVCARAGFPEPQSPPSREIWKPILAETSLPGDRRLRGVALDPTIEAIRTHVMSAERMRADDNAGAGQA
jgi:hypothetical protein